MNDGIVNFNILFDNPHRVHYAGQTLTGRIALSLSEQLRFNCINIETTGRSRVRWEENRRRVTTYDSNGNKIVKIVSDVFNSTEKHYNHEAMVFGNMEDSRRVLPIGEHEIPFSFLLPATLPSSFVGKYGYIRYVARASLVRPAKAKLEVRALFTVISPLDLNTSRPNLTEPIDCHLDRTFGLCCTSGTVSITLSLPVGGAVSGETLLPSVRVDNSSNTNLHLKLQFVELVKYHAKGKIKNDKVEIIKKDLGSVSARGFRTWEREPFPIPSLPPSNLSPCRNIVLKHQLRLKCKSAGLHRNIILELPVVIGTIPLHRNFREFLSAQLSPPPGWNFSPSAPTLDEPPNYNDLPPPSYEEAISASLAMPAVITEEDDQPEVNDAAYTLRYPVYSPTNTL